MGSCDNLTTFNEPLCDSAVEQPSSGEVIEEPVLRHCACSMTPPNMIGASVNGINLSGGCLCYSKDDKTCSIPDDFKTTGIDNRDGLLTECANVVGMGLGKVLDDQCGVNGAFFNENQFANVVCSLPGRCLEFSQDIKDVCESSSDVMTVVDNRDLLVSDMAAFVPEKFANDECGACFTENKSEVDVCSVKINAMCLGGLQGEKGSMKSLNDCEMLPSSSSRRGHVLQVQQIDNNEVGILEVAEEKADILPPLQVGTGNQTLPFEGCSMPLELNPETGSSGKHVSQHECKDDKVVGCLSGEGVMEEKSYDLAGLQKDTSDQMSDLGSSDICDKGSVKSLDDCEMLRRDSSPRGHVLQDQQIDNKEVGIVEVVEEKTDVLPPVQGGTGNQTFLFEGCSMSLELNPETGSSGNCVLQHECKDDKVVGCLSGEGVMEEKFYDLAGMKKSTSDQMLRFGSSSMPLKLTPMIGLVRNHVLRGDQKVDKGIHCCSSLEGVTEGMEENIALLDGLEKDRSDLILSSQGCKIPSGLVPQNGLLRKYVQQDNQNNAISISCPPPEETMEQKIDTYDKVLPSPGCVMPSKVPPGTCVQLNNQKHDEGLSGPSSEEVTEGKSYALAGTEKDVSKPVLCFQDEQRDNRDIDRPSAESITKFVEERSDATTNIKVEICTNAVPVKEGLVKKPVSLQPCHPFSGDEDDSSKLDATDLFQKDASSDIVSISVDDGGIQADHGEQDTVAVDFYSKIENPEILPSSSKKSKKTSRSSRKSQKKRTARNNRTTVKVQGPQSNADFVFKFARKKRSCFSKPARASIWGLLGNITHFFDKIDLNRFNEAQNQASRKAKGNQRSRKQNKNRTSGNLLGSSRKSHSYTRCFRLKVKVGKEVCQSNLNILVPEVVDTVGSDDAIVSDYKSESYQRNSLEFPNLTNGVDGKLGGKETERQNEYFNKSTEDAETHDSVLDAYPANKDVEGPDMSDKSAVDVSDEYLLIPAHKGVEVLGGASRNCYMDPGTSPDSEVINLVPDAQVGARSQEELHKTVLASPKARVATRYVINCKRGKKKDDFLLADNCILEETSLVAANKKKSKPSKKREGRKKMVDNFGSGETLAAFAGTNAPSISSSNDEDSMEPFISSRETELGIDREQMVPSIKSEEYQVSKSSKADQMRKGKSKVSGSARNRRKNTDKQEGILRNSVNKSEMKKCVSATQKTEMGDFDQVEDKTAGSNMADDAGKSDGVDSSLNADEANVDIVSCAAPQLDSTSESAWVRCDDCYKWRRIQVALANSIGENCRWVCKDNLDKAYADCSTTQEKTNADINAELGLSDCEEDTSDGLLHYNGSGKGLDYRSVAGSAFRRIDSNVFLHRSRKTQTIDEIMVCHCKPPSDGRLGCGDECLNRMLNIECVQGTCPCGDRCSNQQFQKRKYANMRWLPCGKKGFGLHSLDIISTGHFIIEYVGEVLDMQTYEARQNMYAANGHKHFYFMTLNGSEVIDACAKGNLGRFINHSCDPNCRTEKWMVNGEICIGLFALRDIKKGEELTFDYNYVRVFGAAAKKCHCGSPQCRGYIGGDPLNTEVVYQGDSDDEYPEPVMLEDGETGDDLDKIVPKTCFSYGVRTEIAETTGKHTDNMDNSIRAVRKLEIDTQIEDSIDQSVSAASQLQSSLEIDNSKGVQPVKISQAAEDETDRLVSTVQPDTSVEEKIVNKTPSLVQEVGNSSPTLMSRKSKSDTVEAKRGISRSLPRIKTSRPSSSIKKAKVTTSPVNGNKVKMMANKVQHLPVKPKKPMEGSSNDRVEAVQEKLNELLDDGGGISKRKDAAKGYLKLLFLTAASGNSGNGEAIQSNRALSMILDALLKTKSRVVLKDIIDKNGLQMLHNIMKQYRRDFKKIPILRKLLKVLEYLASRKILTLDHIIGGPPRPGMESFRESILSLTEHDDKQVHQIARNFRDTWIPKPCRKSSYMDRDDSRMDFHRGLNCNRFLTPHNNWHDQSLRPSEAIDCVKQSSFATTSVDSCANEVGLAPSSGGSQTNGTKTRKRKSRWDQPAERSLDATSHNHKGGQLVLDPTNKASIEDSSCPSCVHSDCIIDETISSADGGQITQEDVPPGFSSPLNPPLNSSDASSTTDHPLQNVSHLKSPIDVALGHPQGRFISRLPVSYGIPLCIVEQFGSLKTEPVESWVIAPGMPFHPFPPLPPFPRDKKERVPAFGSVEECRQDSHCLPMCHQENNPSTTGASQSGAGDPDADTQQTHKRMRGSSNDLGKRFFRQQKLNKGPPWLWRRNELRSSYCSQDIGIGFRADKPSSNFYQRPPHENRH